MFGDLITCHICKKEIIGNYHRFHCDISGIDEVLITHPGDCYNKFRGDYVEPFESTIEKVDKPMKYKIGDKVKLIRNFLWDTELLIDFDKLPDKVATIENINFQKKYYCMKEIPWEWKESDIEGLKEIDKPIKNRWEILDIRRD